jgi:hypothetical protein
VVVSGKGSSRTSGRGAEKNWIKFNFDSKYENEPKTSNDFNGTWTIGCLVINRS